MDLNETWVSGLFNRCLIYMYSEYVKHIQKYVD